MDAVRLIIITVPPPAVRMELSGFRAGCAAVAASYAACVYPPHVTLRTGVLVPEADLSRVLDDFGRLLAGVERFEMRTGAIVSRTIARDGGEIPIVALEIEPSPSLLALNARLLGYEPYRASDRTAFWPHLTLAFQDLSPGGQRRLEAYLAARDELRARRFSWVCDNVSLYRQRGRGWHPQAILGLG